MRQTSNRSIAATLLWEIYSSIWETSFGVWGAFGPPPPLDDSEEESLSSSSSDPDPAPSQGVRDHSGGWRQLGGSEVTREIVSENPRTIRIVDRAFYEDLRAAQRSGLRFI